MSSTICLAVQVESEVRLRAAPQNGMQSLLRHSVQAGPQCDDKTRWRRAMDEVVVVV
jgi:hypothetical protein